MKYSKRDKILLNAIKDSWKHTRIEYKFMIVGELLLLFSLVGYGMKYLMLP